MNIIYNTQIIINWYVAKNEYKTNDINKIFINF